MFKEGVRGDDRGNRGEVIGKVESDRGQSDPISDKGGSHVSQGGDGVVAVPGVLDAIQRGTPVKIETEVWLACDLISCHLGSMVGREGGHCFGKACCGCVYFQQRADKP